MNKRVWLAGAVLLAAVALASWSVQAMACGGGASGGSGCGAAATEATAASCPMMGEEAPAASGSHGTCPVGIEGAKVKVTDIRGGVRIEVTASDSATVAAIRAKAQRCQQMAARAGSGAAAPMYTCPMHPAVTMEKPGNCPECGMRLERTTAASATGSTGTAPAHHGH